jgi:hypothetical protein
VRAAEARRSGRGGGDEPAAVETVEHDEDADEPLTGAGPSPATSRRKRKKRR